MQIRRCDASFSFFADVKIGESGRRFLATKFGESDLFSEKCVGFAAGDGESGLFVVTDCRTAFISDDFSDLGFRSRPGFRTRLFSVGFGGFGDSTAGGRVVIPPGEKMVDGAGDGPRFGVMLWRREGDPGFGSAVGGRIIDVSAKAGL